MVRLLGLTRSGPDDSPREITRTIPGDPVGGSGGTGGGGVGESGWLIRFFDSAFFCEWIAVSYLYKHAHSGVRDYLCNRMYTLPLTGIESYLFQICYMLVHKPSPSLDKFVVDTCAKSLCIALKVHWFLMAELEDSEDSEGISRIQEKCQIAATLMADWPPLVRTPVFGGSGSANTPSSPKGNPVLTRILSSKQRLLSLTSSPALGSSPSTVEENSKHSTTDSNIKSNSKVLPSSEENKLFKKLIPGPKVRDALSFRKSAEKEVEENDKDGFFRRLLRDSKEKDEDGVDKDGFFRRLSLRDNKEKDEGGMDKDGFFRRLSLRDSKDKDEEGVDKDGFFRRLLRDSKDGDDELTSSSDGLLKRLFRDKEDKLGDHEDEEGFFRKIFKDKNEEKKDGGHDKSTLENEENGNIDEDEKDGFFRRLFKDKNEERKDGAHDMNEEDKVRGSIEDDDRESFFKRLFKDKHEEKRGAAHDRNADEVNCNGTVEDVENDGFFKRLFKDKHDEKREEGHLKYEEDCKINGTLEEEEESSVFLSFRRLFRVRSDVVKTASANENGSSGIPFESSPGTENFFKRLFRDRDQSVEDSELFGSKNLREKHPGSPRQRDDKSYPKPPLPNNTTSQIRKGTYHGSLEFVQSLCDTSYGLVDIFPIEDRKIALRESLQEINAHLVASQKSGGICFPMGKGMHRVVHIPEDEAVLLNSREKAPYLICVEVLKGEMQSQTNATPETQKLSKGGIPLANGDVQLPKPPPWAYPLWNQHDLHRYEMLKSTSQAIDQAMAQLWEAKVKFVHVILSVDKRSDGCQKGVKEPDLCGTSLFSMRSPTNTTGNGYDPADGLRSNDDHNMDWISVSLSAVPGVNMEDIEDQEPPRRKEHRRVPSTIAIEEVKAAAAKGQAPLGLPLKGAAQSSSDEQPKVIKEAPKPSDALSGELWEVKKERIQSLSTYGKSPGWDLRSEVLEANSYKLFSIFLSDQNINVKMDMCHAYNCVWSHQCGFILPPMKYEAYWKILNALIWHVIVKSGDDCRQEHLAVQLVSHFYDIYQEAGLPLWLRPYEVLVTSSYTALIETIPDTASIHSIKSRFQNISSLRDYFVAKYEEDSPSFKLAQRNFVESMAGYSILCYLLQVKDRHNGNLLMDEEGHIIHIDFGFILSNSPGGVNFESAPFKLTRELLEVMDSDAEGNPSEFFDYFKVLCIQGFLTCRKHAECIILIVEMLQDSGFPCFKGGPRTIQNLRKRFHLSLTEEHCVSLVLSLISSSLDAWRTRQYDYYQRVLNGIL